jgi:hypothetical protein
MSQSDVAIVTDASGRAIAEAMLAAGHKDAPISRSVQRTGRLSSLAILGGLHHQYVRI